MSGFTNLIGEGKRRAVLIGFGVQLEKGRRDTSHLTLKEITDKNGHKTKRWVSNESNSEHAQHGSHVEFTHKGSKVTGTVGNVRKTGEYGIKLDKEHGGHTVNKHPHQFDSPHEKKKAEGHAGNAQDENLQKYAENKENPEHMREVAAKELEKRGKGKFSNLKSHLEKRKKDKGGINLDDPDTKEAYDQIKDLPVPDLHNMLGEKGWTEQEQDILKHVINEKTSVSGTEKIQTYKDKLDYVMDTPHAHLFTYGKGGIGKTYNVKQAIKNKYGKDAEFNSAEHSYGSDDYDAAFLGKVTTSALYKLLYAHNGKTIVFDDADDILKDPVAVNMFKRAMDTSDSTLNYDSSADLKLTDQLTGQTAIVPKDFKFKGKVVFISNKPRNFFTDTEDKRALLSRGDSMELGFSNDDTLGLLDDHIIPAALEGKTEWKILKDKIPFKADEDGDFKQYDTESPEFAEFKEDLTEVVDMLKKHKDEIPDGELNGRTLQKLYGVYSHAKKINRHIESGKRSGENKRDIDKVVLSSLRGSLSKARKNELIDEAFDDLSKGIDYGKRLQAMYKRKGLDKNGQSVTSSGKIPVKMDYKKAPDEVKNIFDDRHTKFADLNSTTETLKISDLIATQKHVKSNFDTNKKHKELPTIVKHSGSYYIMNGHHRTHYSEKDTIKTQVLSKKD